MNKKLHCGECEHFDPYFDPYGLFDGYCDLYERGRNKKANVMEDKVIYCGECEKLLYEDTDGFGRCGKTKEVCYCGDKCHLKYGKP